MVKKSLEELDNAIAEVDVTIGELQKPFRKFFDEVMVLKLSDHSNHPAFVNMLKVHWEIKALGEYREKLQSKRRRLLMKL